MPFGNKYTGMAVTVLLGVLVAVAAAQQLPPSTNAPRVGDKAPDFTLPDTNGHLVKLSDLLKTADGKGQWVLLVFYRGYW
ncbi:MAG: redoxin domain-containing protein [Acidobacteriia bacterium]|jgi:cytochrome oxidase Cu insertion factor (SCO1/SenC/PrrC family)|nr:redoxin domain-containing protein [Terriglobia bacterium]